MRLQKCIPVDQQHQHHSEKGQTLFCLSTFTGLLLIFISSQDYKGFSTSEGNEIIFFRFHYSVT